MRPGEVSKICETHSKTLSLELAGLDSVHWSGCLMLSWRAGPVVSPVAPAQASAFIAQYGFCTYRAK